ncbi:COX assembly mitochondrial protein 2 [Glycine max]|nr:COX assembly mitochondrial protein 2 [Glycine max]
MGAQRRLTVGRCCRLIWLWEDAPSFNIAQTPNIIEQFQKCHIEHPIAKFFGECTDLKIKLDRCFREEKALKRKANFEESKKLKEQLRALRKENAASSDYSLFNGYSQKGV